MKGTEARVVSHALNEAVLALGPLGQEVGTVSCTGNRIFNLTVSDLSAYRVYELSPLAMGCSRQGNRFKKSC